MKFNKIMSVVAVSTLLIACGGESKKQTEENSTATENETTETTEPTETTEAAEVTETTEETFDLNDKGVGPVQSITLEEIDESLVETGKELFKANCTACHKISKRFVGPAIGGVMERRSPEWIMNMILNPEKMVEENEQAKKLLEEFNAPMANQNLTEEEARAILEYFRTK